MLDHEVRELAVEWACLGEYYRTPLSDQVCGFYSRDLADLPLPLVIAAMRRMRMDPKRRQLPMPADVRERIKPEGDGAQTAVEAAARITSAIAKFGYTNTKRAEAYIGPIGWRVVDQMGGWDHLCQSLKTSEMGTFYAQARELCKVAASRTDAEALTGAGRDLLEGRLTELTARC